MAAALIAIDQAGHPTQETGTAGKSRDDIVKGTAVQLRNGNDTGVRSWRWEILDQPDLASPDSLNNPISATPTFTPNAYGTYRIRLTVNQGRTGEVDTRLVACRTAGSALRVPAADERSEANWNDPATGSPNERGWMPDLKKMLEAAPTSDTLAQVLAVGNETDNQTIKGTDDTTSALSALTLEGGEPSNSGENGGPVSITGGKGASAGSGTGGDVEIAGGTPRLGLSALGGTVTVHGGDAGDSTQGGGQAVFRGGDDAQGALTTAGDITIRGGDSTGDRDGSECTIRGGNSGNISAKVGGKVKIAGGLGGLQGTGGPIEIVSGTKQGGTGGNTGNITIRTEDYTPTEFTGTGSITIKTGSADHAGSNHAGDITISGGVSGTGTGDSADITITAGEQKNTSDQAGNVTISGGLQSGTGTANGGDVVLEGGDSTGGNGDGGDVKVNLGTGSGSGVDGDFVVDGPTGGDLTFNGESGDLTLPKRMSVGGGAFTDAPADADEAVLGTLSASNTGITLLTGTSGIAHVVATDSAGAVRGALKYRHDTTRWEIMVEGGTKLSLLSTDLIPTADGGLNNGGTSQRWDNFYCKKHNVRSTSGFAETNLLTRTHALRSTDGSNNDETLATLTADGEHCGIDVFLRGQEEGSGDTLTQSIRQSFYRTGGTVTAHSAHVDDTQSAGTVTGWAVDLVISGNNIDLRVVGAAATNIRWAGHSVTQVGGTNAS